MYRKILVAHNGTPDSLSALQECIRLAPGRSAEIHLLIVVNLPSYLLIGEYAAAAMLTAEEDLVTEKQKMKLELTKGHALLADAGLNVTSYLEVGEPVNVIAEWVAKLGIELVIVGHSRHKPLALRWWRGSMDTLLVEKIRCSLLVAADSQ